MKRIDFLNSVAELDFFGFANVEPFQPTPFAVVTGTAGDDTLDGTSGADAIYGLGGDDIIRSLGEGQGLAEIFDGGEGYDTLYITSGPFKAFEDLRNSTLTSIEAIQVGGGRTGGVVLNASQFGNGGISESVTFIGGANGNFGPYVTIYMDNGPIFDMSNFNLPDRGLDHRIQGTSGNDTLISTARTILYYTGDGFPIRFFGGDGDDTLDARGTASMDGGDGIDTVTYENYALAAPIKAELSSFSGSESTIYDPNVFIYHIAEILRGSASADTLGTSVNNTQVFGGAGNDTLFATSDNAVLNGEAGDDRFTGSANNDAFNGGDGDDTAVYGGVYSDYTITVAGSGVVTVSGGGAGTDTLTSIEFLEIGGVTYSATSGGPSGTPGDDSYTGTPGNDTYNGLGGNDTIVGLAGDDTFDGGDGNDRIHGGEGNDTLLGGDGNDTFLFTNSDGNTGDFIFGGAGTDTLRIEQTGTVWERHNFFNTSFDSIEAVEFATVSSGGLPSEIFFLADQFGSGQISETAVFEGTGVYNLQNIIFYMAGKSSFDMSGFSFSGFAGGLSVGVVGDADAETIIGSDVNDIINGQGGDDRIEGGAGNDTINGWTGFDTAVYVGEHTRYVMSSDASDVITVTSIDTGTGTDTLTFIDFIEFGGVTFTTSGSAPSFTAGADRHIGGNADETFDALAGDDIIYGLGGHDLITGGAGADYMNGGDGVDTVSYAASNAGVDVTIGGRGYYGDAEGDILVNIENIYGSTYNDVMYGDAGANRFDGGSGRDVLRGYGGNDVLNGGDEIGAGDVLEGGAGNDILRGDGGNDQLFGGDGADQLYGGTGNDILYTQGEDTVVSGGFGYDYLVVSNTLDGGTWAASDIEEWYGNAGNETFDATGSVDRVIMVSNEGNDILIGGYSNDVLLGGAGDDIVFGGTGNDDLFGGVGADEIYGGGGSDFIRFDADDTVVSGGADYDYALAQGTEAVAFSLTNGFIEFAIGTSGNDQLSGEYAPWHVTIYGGDGHDTIYAGRAGSYLRGQAGQDTIVGGSGADYIEGGADADFIWMLDNGGTDYMYDFQDGVDFINLSQIAGVSGFGDITVDSSNSASGWFSVNYGTGTLWLQAGSGASINAGDFIFAPAAGQYGVPNANSVLPDMLAAGDVNTPLPEAVDLDQFIFDDAAFVADADEAFDTFSDAAFGEAQAVEAMAAWCDANDLSEIGDPELPDMFVHPEDIGYFYWG